MKKRFVVATVITALGIIYTGVSWYTGKIVEQKIDYKFTQLNKYLAEYSKYADIQFSYTDYQRGLFTTKLTLVVDSTADKGTFFESNQQVFKDRMTIYHGPFPWSEVKQGNLKPLLGGLTYEMTKEFSEELWELAGNKPFINIRSSIDYNENIDIKGQSIAIKNDDVEKSKFIDVSEGNLSILADKYLRQVSLSFNLDKLEFQQKDNILNLMGFSINVMQEQDDRYMVNNTINQIDGPFILTSDFSIENIKSRSLDNDNQLNINNLTIGSNITTDNYELFSGTTHASLSSVIYNKQNLGKGNYSFKFDNLPIKQLMSNSVYLSNSDKEWPIIENMIIDLETLEWQNSAGKIDTQFYVKLSDITLVDNEIPSLADSTDNISEFRFRFNLPFEVLYQFVAQVENSKVEGEISKQALNISKAMTNMLLSFVHSAISRIAEYQEDDTAVRTAGIYSNIYLSVENQEASINGRESAIEYFFEDLEIE